MTALLPVERVNIPDNVIIACPKFRFDNKLAARHCPQCEYFHGIGVMRQPDEASGWHQCYVIRCAHIIERRTSSID